MKRILLIAGILTSFCLNAQMADGTTALFLNAHNSRDTAPIRAASPVLFNFDDDLAIDNREKCCHMC